MVAGFRFFVAVCATLLASGCRETPPTGTWRDESFPGAAIIVEIPVEASVHEFETAVLVHLWPVFKPILGDWQYAVDIQLERLEERAFENRLSPSSDSAQRKVSECIGGTSYRSDLM